MIHCLAWSLFNDKISDDNISVFIPTQPNLSEAKIDTQSGRARLSKAGDHIEWRIGALSGQQTADLKLELITATTAYLGDIREWKKPPITMKFTIEMYTTSGIEILNLHVVS